METLAAQKKMKADRVSRLIASMAAARARAKVSRDARTAKEKSKSTRSGSKSSTITSDLAEPMETRSRRSTETMTVTATRPEALKPESTPAAQHVAQLANGSLFHEEKYYFFAS